jgi:ketosteroid isomerase-like protein
MRAAAAAGNVTPGFAAEPSTGTSSSVISRTQAAAELKGDQAVQTVESFLSEWTTAECDGDSPTLETLLTSDFTAVGPLGFILSKQAWLARHRQGDLTYDRFGLAEVQTRMLGEVAVVTARNDTRGTYQGHPLPEAVRATFVLVSDSGTWRLAAIHMSFIAGTPGAPPIPGASVRREGGGSAA